MLEQAKAHHSWYEDAQALVAGVVLLTLGVVIYVKATLLTGGLAGLSLLAEFAGFSDFGTAFFVLNLPFYGLALLRMGWRFTLRTVLAVTLISLFARLTPIWVQLDHVHPAYAAVGGGVMTGAGIILMLRHNFSAGGVNVLAHFLQERNIIRAGYAQLIFDLMLFASAFFVLPPERVGWSVLGAVVMNMTIAINHRPGRYMGVS